MVSRLSVNLRIIAATSFILVFGLGVMGVGSCTERNTRESDTDAYAAAAAGDEVSKTEKAKKYAHLFGDTVVDSPYTRNYGSIREGSYREIFNDSNCYHLPYAQALGAGPFESTAEIRNHPELIEISSCEQYRVDSLTHSVPYLVPKAKDLLGKIGKRFTEKAKSYGNYRVLVTSLTRTPELIKDLQKRNRNSVTESCHQYGTTFDLSYTKFFDASNGEIVGGGVLKDLLAETLLEMRNSNLCLIKYEIKTPCFHVTVAR